MCDLQILKAATWWQTLRENQKKDCKIAYRFELDDGLSTKGSAGLGIGIWGLNIQWTFIDGHIDWTWVYTALSEVRIAPQLLMQISNT